MPNKELIDQVRKIKKELDAMVKALLNQKGYIDVVKPIFTASTEISRAEILLMMRDMTPEQMKELGMTEENLINLGLKS